MPQTTRRTQAERRSETRGRLLDAAQECVAEKGCERTTLADVVERAGLTNGALWRHFPSKAALMAALASRCSERLTSSLPTARGATPQGRLTRAVEGLWGWADEPDLQVLVELLRAGRGDPELRETLTASDRAAAQAYYDHLAQAVGPEVSSLPTFRRSAKVLGLALYGTALTAELRTPLARRRLLAEVQALAAELLLPEASQEVSCG